MNVEKCSKLAVAIPPTHLDYLDTSRVRSLSASQNNEKIGGGLIYVSNYCNYTGGY
jgi:hypothetical protein